MTTLVTGAIGAVIGWFVGGPTGAYYGFVVGSAVGGYIDTANTTVRNVGPRLSDLKVTVSSMGNFIPIEFGVMRISGNIIESTDYIPSEHTTRSGGKGGPKIENTTTTYSVSFMVVLCMSKGTHTVRRIWAGGRLIYSASTAASAGTLLAASSSAATGAITIYNGAATQMPDPTLEALYGVGNVPAYRGYLTVMFKDFPLADFSNNLAATQLTFEVVENPNLLGAAKLLGTINNATELSLQASYVAMAKDSVYAWASANQTGVPSDHAHVYRNDGKGFKLLGVYTTSDMPDEEIYVIDPGRPGNAGSTPPIYAIPPTYGARAANVVPNAFTGVVVSDEEAMVWRYNWPLNRAAMSSGFTSYDPPTAIVFYDALGAPRGAVSLLGTGMRSTVTSTNGGIAAKDPQTEELMIASQLVTSSPATWTTMLKIGSGVYVVFPDERMAGLNAGSGVAMLVTVFIDGTSSTGLRYKLHVIDEATGEDRANYPGPEAGTGTPSRHMVFLWSGSVVVTLGDVGLQFEWDDTGAWKVLTSGTSGGRTLSWRGPSSRVYEVISGSAGYALTSDVWVTGPGAEPSGKPTIRRVLKELCAAKKVTAVNFRNLANDGISDVLNGLVITRLASARGAIAYVQSAYRVDNVESQGTLVFVKRGGVPVRTLKRSELVASVNGSQPQEPLQEVRGDELLLPRLTTVNYSDMNNAYQAGAALSPQRLNTDSEQTANLDVTALALSGEEAAQLADVSQAEAWANRTSYKFQTTIAHEDLEPTDVILMDESA